MMKILFKNALTLKDGRADIVSDGQYIASVKKASDAEDGGVYDRVIDCTDRIIMPGLYNCHTHAAMTLFRGYGEDMPLDRWLSERIFPAEDLLTPEAVYVASKFACAEMIKNGIVSFTDMYFMCDRTVQAVAETGMKANISRSLVSFDMKADPKKDERFIEAAKLFETYHNTGDGRIKIDMSVHAEYTNTEATCRALAEYAVEHGAHTHVHVSETEKEHEECKARRGGRTPVEFLRDCGIFDVPCTAAHCVYVTEKDMDIMAEKGVSAAHNPASNLKLGSGIMPLGLLEKHGVNVTLGSDGTASNNTLDVMKEMYIASILHKGTERRAEAHPAASFIGMVTKNGALSQGRDDCGELKAGMKADIILIDTSAINNIPAYSPDYTVVYSANSSNVVLTMCDGRILYENGEFRSFDMEKLMSDMKKTCAEYFR